MNSKKLDDLSEHIMDIAYGTIADLAEKMAYKPETEKLTGHEALMRFADALRSTLSDREL